MAQFITHRDRVRPEDNRLSVRALSHAVHTCTHECVCTGGDEIVFSKVCVCECLLLVGGGGGWGGGWGGGGGGGGRYLEE